jgi:hypothetical protein
VQPLHVGPHHRLEVGLEVGIGARGREQVVRGQQLGVLEDLPQQVEAGVEPVTGIGAHLRGTAGELTLVAVDQSVEDRPDRGGQEIGLGDEVTEDRPLRETGPLADLGRGEAVRPGLDQHLGGSVEQLGPGTGPTFLLRGHGRQRTTELRK